MIEQPHDPPDNPMSRLCGARKKSGGTCRAPALPNSARCHYHGGKTPRGIASPHFRTGRYSKHLPGGLAALYEQARTDPDLLNLTDEIALYQGRLLDLLAKLQTGGSGERWHQIRDAWRTLQRAISREDAIACAGAAERLDALLADPAGDEQVWSEIDRTVARYQSLVADERKRRIEMQALVSADRAVGFAREVLLAVRAHVSDPEALARIQGDVTEALGRRREMADQR